MTKPAVLLAMPVVPDLHARLAARYTLYGPLMQPAPEAIPEAARSARALVSLGGFRTTAALMAALPGLGLIACYGTGFDSVDIVAASQRGIVVTHAGDANAASVAEFAMGLVLATARHIVAGDRMIRAGQWTNMRIDRMPLAPGLAGRRLGIYGLGNIGLQIARRAAAFDMEIGYHNRAPRPGLAYTYHASLMDLATWSDILVIAVRASADNERSVNQAVLEALGPTGILVNIARGSVVDEEALCTALEAGRLGGAGLDVFAQEPQVPERLRQLPNVVLTPHMAAISRNAQERQQQVLLDNLEAFFSGGELRNRVPGPA